VAPLAEATEEELARTWKLVPEQIAASRRLKLVVSTPIRSEGDPSQVIGMLTIDSEVEGSQCGLASEDSLDEAWQVAVLIGRILKHTQIV
jgi:hypothetical protein